MSRVLKGSVSGNGSLPSQVVGMNKPVIGQVAKSGCPISGVTSIQSQSVTQSTVTILSSPTPGMPGVLPGNVLSVQHQKTVSVTTPSMSGSATMATPIVGTSACVNGASVQQGVPGGIGQQQSNGMPPKPPVSDGTPNTSTPNLANTKEKTPMCLVNELARFNKIQHTYTLTDEQGPAHKKVFFVKLKLGDEEYPASGPSIKKAQHAAAAIALEATQYKHPPPKPPKTTMTGGNPSITPTVELNALAMKLGMPTVYRTLEAARHFNPSGLNFRGIYNQRYQYPRYARIFYVSLKVGQREFIGEGNTRQSARHNAAEKALKILSVIPITPEEASKVHSDKNSDAKDGEEVDRNPDTLKSEISLVHEIALKRNMHISFEVIKESGPPHMKTFITRCTCGDIVTEGEGNSKKLSKKRSAEKMLNELNKLPPLTVTVNKAKKNTMKKKNSRNLIKKQKADPDYGVGINPISRLIQIQQAKKEKEPVYTLIAEKGQPRRKEFVMQVSVGDKSCTGEGPNKKLAKRSAAEAMLQLLGYSRPAPQPSKPAIKTGDAVSPGTDKKVTFLDTDNTTNSRQLVPGVLLMPETGGAMTGITQNVFVTQRQPNAQLCATVGDRKEVKYSPQATAAIAKELLDKGCSPTAEALKKQCHKDVLGNNVVRPKQQLLYLADVLGFKVEFTDLPTKNNDFFSLVSLSTNPPQVSHGGGHTIEESHDKAALSALKALSASGLNIVTEPKDVDQAANTDGLHTKKKTEADHKEFEK